MLQIFFYIQCYFFLDLVKSPSGLQNVKYNRNYEAYSESNYRFAVKKKSSKV